MQNYLSRVFKGINRRVNPLQKITQLRNENALLREKVAIWKNGPWEPGHFYTPQNRIKDLPENITLNGDDGIPGVDLRAIQQLELLEKLAVNYPQINWPEEKRADSRYYFKNDYFCYSDAVFLDLIMSHFRPKRIIEVGSGFSSALMLDANEKNRIGAELTFVEPYPSERLEKLVSKSDHCTVIADFVQNVSTSIWETLEKNDILFIDSSHVSKFNSDVNDILFRILPVLKPGVIIHFHDIFFPFEYPLEWLKEGRSWNEAYMLRAFLQYNSQFNILIFPSLLELKYRSWFEQHMPLCLRLHERKNGNTGNEYISLTGQSIYLIKT
jgi:predicted O-methyltransferase YrrM